MKTNLKTLLIVAIIIASGFGAIGLFVVLNQPKPVAESDPRFIQLDENNLASYYPWQNSFNFWFPKTPYRVTPSSETIKVPYYIVSSLFFPLYDNVTESAIMTHFGITSLYCSNGSSKILWGRDTIYQNYYAMFKCGTKWYVNTGQGISIKYMTLATLKATLLALAK